MAATRPCMKFHNEGRFIIVLRARGTAPGKPENLERDIAELLSRPVGRPSHKPVAELEDGAAGAGEDRVPFWRTVPACGFM